MKFVTFAYGSRIRPGVLENTKIREVETYESTLEIIKNYGSFTEDRISKDKIYDLNQVTLLSPIPKPIHDILCVGKNYKDHIEEMGGGVDFDDFVPQYFSKRAVKILGSREDVRARFDVDPKVDYEVELAVIIGKEAFQVEAEEAEDYIFGYSIFNDLSSRTIQRKHVQFYRGKSFDDYSIMGPAIVSKDEFNHPLELNLKTYVNEELRQSSNTKYLIYTVPKIIEEITQTITLEPGDIIATGTPSGVGGAKDGKGFLKDGDYVRCEIEGIGVLENKIVAYKNNKDLDVKNL